MWSDAEHFAQFIAEKKKQEKKIVTDVLDLYGLAEQHTTQVYWFDLDAAQSLSLVRRLLRHRNGSLANADRRGRKGQVDP